VQAGKMRHRVVVQMLRAPSRDAAQLDPYNAPPSPAKEENWYPVCTRWAEIKPLSGQEIFQGQQVRPDITHQIKMRWFKEALTYVLKPGVDPKMRLVFEGRPLNVVSCVNIGERRRELDIRAIEQV
jgi:SPP1 family predicted phage head-tail adaptor